MRKKRASGKRAVEPVFLPMALEMYQHKTNKTIVWLSLHLPDVKIVLERHDAEHEDAAGDEFGDKLLSLGKEGCWVCAEDAGGRGGSWRYSANAFTLEIVDGSVVIRVDNSRSEHTTEELSYKVDRESLPRKATI